MKNDILETCKRGGIFTYDLIRDGKVIDSWKNTNLVPYAGLDYMNDVSIGGGTKVANFYIALYSNAYTPQNDDLYTHIGTRFTEITAEYSETTRQLWVRNANSVDGFMSNSNSRAAFNFTAPATVNGGLFVSNNVKGDNTSGLLLADSAHTPARDVLAGDELLVKYEFQSSSS